MSEQQASRLARVGAALEGLSERERRLVALMLVGRYLQQRAVQRNRDYLLANDGAEHVHGKRLRDGRF